MPGLRFGIHSGQQYESFSELAGLWVRAEELGLDWVSVFDHVRPPVGGPLGPCLEGPTALAALATVTERVRCAILVAAVGWRHPAQLAHISMTLDHISGGRFELGLGAGGPDDAHGEWGWVVPPRVERIHLLEETCRIVRSLWTNESTTIAGRHVSLNDAHMEPKPLQPAIPIVIGGSSRQILRVAVHYATVWNALGGDIRQYRGAVRTMENECHLIGRSPADLRQSVTFRAVLASTTIELEKRMRGRFEAIPECDRREYITIGTPASCVTALEKYAEVGVRDFILAVRPPVDWPTLELFATEVAPALRKRLAPQL